MKSCHFFLYYCNCIIPQLQKNQCFTKLPESPKSPGFSTQGLLCNKTRTSAKYDGHLLCVISKYFQKVLSVCVCLCAHTRVCKPNSYIGERGLNSSFFIYGFPQVAQGEISLSKKGINSSKREKLGNLYLGTT